MDQLLFPGDITESNTALKHDNSKTLTLGPGLQYLSPSTVSATVAGAVVSDQRRNAIWLESNGRGRYSPAVGDLVVATVHHSSTDLYHCIVGENCPMVNLAQLAFEGASKKTRPVLRSGSLVYARVSSANKHMDPEIECVHSSTGRAEGLGELKGGNVYDVSLSMARRLMMHKSREDGHISILEDLAAKGLRFEIAVGRNGRVWINGEDLQTTSRVGWALQQTDSNSLNVPEQERLLKRILK